MISSWGPKSWNLRIFADYILLQELNGITDQHVVRDLSAADRRKGYWVEEDPALDRMLQWIRMQR